MLKFIVITLLIGYLIFKVLGMVFKFVLGGNVSSSRQTNQHNYQSSKKPSDGNVNVDYVPNSKSRKKENYKGGEYVDYEEIE